MSEFQKQAYCENCKTKTLHEKPNIEANQTSIQGHSCLTLLTCGLWFPIAIIWSISHGIAIGSQKWRCHVCGEALNTWPNGALCKCKACGADISSSARSCPKCGKVAPRANNLIGFLALLLFGVCFASCLFTPSDDDGNQRDDVNQNDDDKQPVDDEPQWADLPDWTNQVPDLSYKVLREWKPHKSPTGLGIDIFVDPNEATEASLVKLILKVEQKHDPVVIAVYTSEDYYLASRDWESDVEFFEYGPEFLVHHILHFFKNSAGLGAATALSKRPGKPGVQDGRLTWFQEIGPVAHRFSADFDVYSYEPTDEQKTRTLADFDYQSAFEKTRHSKFEKWRTESSQSKPADTSEGASQDHKTPQQKNLRPLREWTSSIGTTVNARLVSRTGNKVKLRREDGKELTVPFDELSETDQGYITNQK